MSDRKLLEHPALDQGPDYERGFIDGMQYQMQSSVDKAVNRMRQPEQEPVAWMYTSHWKGDERFITRYQSELTAYKADKVWPLYTAPQERQPLTDEEMLECAKEMNAEPLAEGWPELVKFARAIEDKLKEKNARND
jgi:hypothetical protein